LIFFYASIAKLLNPRFRFFYYTAGSGGAGPTILTTSFLLLGEDVIAYNKGNSNIFTNTPTVKRRSEFIVNSGEEIKLKPYSGVLNIDFGKGVRKKNVYLLSVLWPYIIF